MKRRYRLSSAKLASQETRLNLRKSLRFSTPRSDRESDKEIFSEWKRQLYWPFVILWRRESGYGDAYETDLSVSGLGLLKESGGGSEDDLT